MKNLGNAMFDIATYTGFVLFCGTTYNFVTELSYELGLEGNANPYRDDAVDMARSTGCLPLNQAGYTDAFNSCVDFSNNVIQNRHFLGNFWAEENNFSVRDLFIPFRMPYLHFTTPESETVNSLFGEELAQNTSENIDFVNQFIQQEEAINDIRERILERLLSESYMTEEGWVVGRELFQSLNIQLDELQFFTNHLGQQQVALRAPVQFMTNSTDQEEALTAIGSIKSASRVEARATAIHPQQAPYHDEEYGKESDHFSGAYNVASQRPNSNRPNAAGALMAHIKIKLDNILIDLDDSERELLQAAVRLNDGINLNEPVVLDEENMLQRIYDIDQMLIGHMRNDRLLYTFSNPDRVEPFVRSMDYEERLRYGRTPTLF